MRFGTHVIVTRGSEGNAPGTPGCLREVRGVYVGASGPNRLVRLLEDDPLDSCGPPIGWTRTGDVGHWCASAVRAARIESEE